MNIIFIAHLKIPLTDSLTVCEPNNSVSVLHRIAYPPLGDPFFYIFDEPDFGLCSLSKSAGFGRFPALPMNPVTNF